MKEPISFFARSNWCEALSLMVVTSWPFVQVEGGNGKAYFWCFKLVFVSCIVAPGVNPEYRCAFSSVWMSLLATANLFFNKSIVFHF